MRLFNKKYLMFLFFLCLLILLHHLHKNQLYTTTKNHKSYKHNIYKEPNILWWTNLAPDYNRIRECGIYKCRMSVDRTLLNQPETQVIVFYGSNMKLDDLPLPRSPNHIWALFHEESPKNLPFIQHENVLKHFNYTSTFSRYSDYPLTIQYLNDYEILRTRKFLVPIADKSKFRKNLAPILFMQSICDTMSGRNEYVQELMKYIQVDSYGKCLHNKELPETLKTDYLQTIDSDELYNFIAPYKFIISYENGVCNDYISEKFWRPLIVGSIPIYFGSPTIQDWLPNKLSAILISDFESPEKLANFIKNLDNNDNEYNKYLDHKYLQINPISNELLRSSIRNRDYTKDDIFECFECYICQEAYKNMINPVHKMATQQHYDCGNKLIYPKMSTDMKSNDWQSILKSGKCQADVLARFLNANKNYTTKEFEKEIYNDINLGDCNL